MPKEAGRQDSETATAGRHCSDWPWQHRYWPRWCCTPPSRSATRTRPPSTSTGRTLRACRPSSHRCGPPPPSSTGSRRRSLPATSSAGSTAQETGSSPAASRSPTAGAMGYHYFNADLMADNAVNALEPEVLVYAPCTRRRAQAGRRRMGRPQRAVQPSRRLAAALGARDGHAHPGPTPRPRVLPHPRLDLGQQPGRHVRRLQPRGQLLRPPGPAREDGQQAAL